jgi:uncharacterized membrane protein (DUF4010 family)
VVAGAVAGFVDTHSAAISAATLVGAGKMTATDAALPILIALSTNTITKVVICIFAGGDEEIAGQLQQVGLRGRFQ